ncbi:MAG: hypothetical protein HZA01_10975 [Nitrospinae bacterium]|nr:hypothetical protein [Nitrospinota bacterium]
MGEVELQQTYLRKISETFERLTACTSFFSELKRTSNIYAFEATVLQLRKALECMAFASIAPNKMAYEKLRSKSDGTVDYRKDYNAKKIIQLLSKVNNDFYPVPVLPATKKKSGEWHFDRKKDGYLTKKQFESLYDRLGKFLHADNPWGNDKGVQNLVRELPGIIDQLHALLALHFTVIRTPEFNGVWVIEAGPTTRIPRVVCGKANGEFVVQ